ncbi:Protein arginine N-methyltransferase 7, partial [Armadillidium nasatum]
MLKFDWSGRNIPLVKKRHTSNSFESLSSGNCDAVFMWWDLKMDPQREIILSCAPLWDHPLTKGNSVAKSSEIPWRDHWMQAIYYFPKTLSVNKSEKLTLISSHDEYSARHVYVHERSSTGRKVFNQFIESNQMSDKVTILKSSLADFKLENIERISLVFCEPFFETSILPWHPLQFLYQLKSCSHLLAENAVVLPQEMTLWGLPVQFRDLWKIRYPLDTCCGFDMKPFDKLIDKACDEIDEPVEPQPLWEYPSIALGSPCQLMSIPLKFEILQEKKIETQHVMPLQSSGTLNGMALWCDWHFPEEVLSTGTTRPVSLGEQVQWDMNTRQGVYLFKKHHVLSESTKTGVVCDTSF